MGRKKVEFDSTKKSPNEIRKVFNKRTKGLLKKASEFSELLGTQVLVIFGGNNHGGINHFQNGSSFDRLLNKKGFEKFEKVKHFKSSNVETPSISS